MNLIEKRSWGLPKWITDLFILNPPKFGYTDYQSISNFKNKLIFIPSRESYIPCLFYRLPKSPNFLIYFHGNSEHIFQIEHYGLDFRSHLEFNVIIVEYPGYSIYEYENPDPNLIFDNSLKVYDWVKETFNVENNKIFVCGRSLGTSPAIFLASRKKVQSLFLISAFTSINDIGIDHNISLLLEDIFKSYKYIKKVNCYTLLIHGEKDKLINYAHSEKLKEELEKNNKNIKVEIHNGKDNDHNNFYLRNDIIEPIKNFLEKYHLISKDQVIDLNPKEINKIYKMPESISRKIESKIFRISNFIFNKNIPAKNANFIMKLIDNRIALIIDTNILIYNSKNYILEEEINVSENCNQYIEINCLFQMKNQNLICSTNNGDIIIYKNDTDSEEYEKEKHEIIDSNVLKIDKLNEGFLCILTKNGILIYDDNDLNKIDTINL
jgi:esterase/lipase